jgi:hypothetical protein
LAASGAQCLLALAGEGLEDGHDARCGQW